MKQADITIIGGGIIGLATAYRLSEQATRKKIVILEKESEVAFHQTGHNSGVLHSGIYYRPGSLRALNCREGKLAMQEFCEREGLPFEICGKVIVATHDSELARLQNIYERGQANGVQCSLIGADRLAEIEPYAAGVKAIHVPEAGIVNYRAVCRRLAEIVQTRNAELLLSAKVTGIEQSTDRVHVTSTAGDVESSLVINCGGLHSDRLAKLGGAQLRAKIVPFRGEYYKLKPGVEHLVKGLIYPVPDPKFPFLGVHFTRMIEGGVECGPNAVLAFAREGYRKTDLNVRDLFESLTYSGFLRLVSRHWKMGLGEIWRSWSKAAFVKALQRLLPAIRKENLDWAPAGVRAQALSPDGSLVDDFLIEEHGRIVNVCNAPSPAATASLNIGKLIVEKIQPRL